MEKNLNKLFADKDFVEAHKDLTTLDEIYAVVVKEVPEVTKEELDEYLCKVSQQMENLENGELDESALEDVAGGAILETLAAAAGIITFCYGAGCAIGKAIKKWRKK